MFIPLNLVDIILSKCFWFKFRNQIKNKNKRHGPPLPVS